MIVVLMVLDVPFAFILTLLGLRYGGRRILADTMTNDETNRKAET